MTAPPGRAWTERLHLRPGVRALAAALFVYGFGEELWFRYLPAYLRVLGASPFLVGLFGTSKDLLDAGYAYPGGLIADRLGSRRALLLFGVLSTAGFALYLGQPSVPVLFAGLLLVMAWQSLGLPATFSLIREELAGGGRLVGFTVQSVVKRLPIILAPPLGGWLIGRYGMGGGMRIGFGVAVLTSLLMLFGLRRSFKLAPAAGAAGPTARRPRVGLHPALQRLLVADCLIRLCEGLPEVFLVVWALEIAKVSAARFGILTAILMATAIASYLPAALLAERAEKKSFVVLTYAFFTLFPLAVVLSHSYAALAAAYVVGGLREIGEPARKALIVDLASGDPGATVGLYYSIRGFAVAGAAALGGTLWTLRPSLTFLVAAGLGAAGTLWAALSLPSQAARSPLA
ncbi:MAG TPA: MFS transporter [Thermoanaerobaculia bacterium]|nr:MFS transporter [Thermoanaerobaculia bacterium]